MRTPTERKTSTAWFDIAPFSRVAMVVVMVLLQFLFVFMLVRVVRNNSAFLYAVFEILCALVMIYFLALSQRPNAYKSAWVLVVMLLGVFGLLLYLFWGRSTLTNALDRRLKHCLDRSKHPLPQDEETLSAFQEEPGEAAQRVGRFLHNERFALYRYTRSDYYALGESGIAAMLEDMRAAEQCIYLEFFIIFQGKVWDSILEVLTAKAAEGVDVRVMYDDMGSIKSSTGAFIQSMRGAGIRVGVFNPVHHHVHQMYLNYRDHRKILIVDQQIAYTGGINLADEYANLYEKHGHWKDTVVRLEGPGVEGFTRFFLMMWHAVQNDDMDAELAAVRRPAPVMDAPGFVVPFEDGPHNNPENPAEALYRQMTGTALRTLYITTPYLVVGESMVDALCTAAASGVDVRLVIPKKPDHWYVHWTSLSFAEPLLRAGVRIYLYTPGFIHAKMIVADQRQCIVGTVNMDYRSFYLHYECGCWFEGGAMPATVHEDICQVIGQSEELTLEQLQKRSVLIKVVQPLLRIFAPLM